MSDPTATKSAGLFTTGNTSVPVPLAGVSIEADVRSFYARVVVAHRYVNHEATAIEAVYMFPLEEGAAVCAFEAVVDGTLVVGEVHERDKAFEMYDDAMQEGHGAFLLDEERPDVFQASVGNLPPGKEVTVRLTYVTELAVNDGRLRFAIPTTVSPRYAPVADMGGTGRPAAEALNPPRALSVPYGLNLSIRVAMPGGITAIESPSHPISLRMNDGGGTVTLVQKDAALDREFVLSIEAPGLDCPQALVEREENGTEAIGVAFAPAFATSAAPAELIFLVDRSGSMSGDSIEEVRNALQLCLRSMTPGCRFNIVGFGSSHEALFPKSRAYEQSTLKAATSHVAGMEANLGGTELLPALRFVLEQKDTAELPRQVVILTDGQVTNTDAVIELAAAHASSARIFTFGIGAGASQHLVRGLARAAGGTAEFIYPGERIEPKVLRQVARLLSPALADVRLEWSGGTVTQAPVKVPPVFAGGRLLVYGFVKGQRPAHVRLTATGPSGPVSFEVPVPPVPDAAESRHAVATLAARARIRELEEGSEWLASRGSQQKGRKVNGSKNEIIALSLRYGLTSRETSFVAIERRETPVTGDVQLRKVPIAITNGWGGQLWSPGAAPKMVPSRSFHIHAALAQPVAESGTWGMRRPSALESSPRMPMMRARAGTTSSGMHSLILLQSADGSWELTKDLASVMGRDLAALRSAVQGASGSDSDVLRAWATALALTWLRTNAADNEDEWRLLAAKGRKWIDGTAAVPPGGRTWIDKADEYLRK